MKGFYIIEIPRKEMETPEDVRRILSNENIGDLIVEGFLKERNISLEDRVRYAYADIDYLKTHTLTEWYENHIFIIFNNGNFYDCDNNDDLWWVAKEYLHESNLKFRKVLLDIM